MAQVLIDSGQKMVQRSVIFDKSGTFIAEIDKEPVVNKVSSIMDIIKQLNQRLHGDDSASIVFPIHVSKWQKFCSCIPWDCHKEWI